MITSENFSSIKWGQIIALIFVLAIGFLVGKNLRSAKIETPKPASKPAAEPEKIIKDISKKDIQAQAEKENIEKKV